MTDKEATVYIVDLGSTMGERNHGRSETNLDWALEYVWDRITTTVQTNRKTLLVGVIGLRTDETGNIYEDQDEYKNIKIYQDLDQLLTPGLRRLRNELVVNNTTIGDAISAFVLAIQMISEKCKKNQYHRKIVLVTDGRAPMDVDDLAEITKKIKEDKIELTVLGVDFDDAEYGFKEEEKDLVKEENEALFKTLCEDCDGNFGTLAQAIDELQIPRLKKTKPVASYKGLLTLGDVSQYDDALAIDVERYSKTMKASPPSASNFALKQGLEATQSTQTMSNGEGGGEDEGLTSVMNARTYQVNDENAPGGKRDIAYDELSKGYTYGSTAVHIEESDRNVTQFETKPSLDILGFVDKKLYNRYLDMNRSFMIVSQRLNDKASMALSSLIHALFEMDAYAVARLVTKENAKPAMVLLTPYIDKEVDFECLYEITLPFAEDVRNFKFPPLDRVVTVSGKHLQVHRNLPSEELKQAMDAYVDSMDLSNFDTDDNGEEAEYARPEDTYNPILHRINHVVKHRVIHPNADPPPSREILTRYSQPPLELVERTKPALDQVIKAADVKKVPKKALGRRFGKKEAPKPLSDLDVGALLQTRTRKRIDAKNAIPEFKQILEQPGLDDMKIVHEACTQLKWIIFDWIKYSVGGSKYAQALEGIGTMREQVIELEEPGAFNDFLKELKAKVLGGELGGDRKEFWFQLRRGRYRPISKTEAQSSDFSEEEAVQFMKPQ